MNQVKMSPTFVPRVHLIVSDPPIETRSGAFHWRFEAGYAPDRYAAP
jgi:hypothetical protein